MLVMAILALIWANSPLGDSYVDLWTSIWSVHVADVLHIDLTLQDWINDFAMAFFFFVVAMEIKKELVKGALKDRRAAALPVFAAAGGMIVPALVYTVFNIGGEGAHGWGVPMATDIAFAVGVLSLLGNRVPSSLVVFLLTLAIADDLGAIVVIAVFYTTGLSFGWLAAAIGTLMLGLLAQRVGIRSLVPYAILAGFCWLAVYQSGVHATLAGVAFGLLTPTQAFFKRSDFDGHARNLVDEIEARSAELDFVYELDPHSAHRMRTLASESVPPLDRLEYRLSPWTTFLVIPVFALANAGVRLSWDEFTGAFSQPVTLGILFGLVVGKTVGISLFSFVAVKLGFGAKPAGASWSQVVGVAMIGGVGFTVALFITELAFDDPSHVDESKVGILVASTIAGVIGYFVLRAVGKKSAAAAEADGTTQAEVLNA